MKERRYKDDWVNETRLDDKGRDKRVPVYTGDKYAVPDWPHGKAFLWFPAACAIAALFAFLIIDDKATRSLIVFIPAAFALFPLLYWIIGLWSVSILKEKTMTRLQREKGIGRMLRSSLGCCLLFFVALIADMIRVIPEGNSASDMAGLILLAAAGGSSMWGLCMYRKLNRQIEKVGSESHEMGN